MKKYIVITGGAGFVGSNLIEFLIKKTNKKIISIDNYSSGYVRNHIKSNKVKYIKGNTANINQILARYKNKIDSLFHFGEFARIFKSFKKFNDCFQSNSIGSKEVFKFCLDNNVRLIYSATSASLGNNGNDKNLSPYSFTKAKNLELLENLKKWFNLKFEIIYFYNVYGKKQIDMGDMATVIGIFEKQYLLGKPLTVVKPGTQKRDFTHVEDIANGTYLAATKSLNSEYHLGSGKNYSILEVAKMFKSKYKLVSERPGERFYSLSKSNKAKKHLNYRIKNDLKSYISNFINKK